VRAAAITLALVTAPAAASPGALAAAEAHYETGEGLFKLGRYEEALREFQIGYELEPRKEFLLDLGQVYRALGDYASAATEYAEYLRRAPPDDPLRDKVQRLQTEAQALARDAAAQTKQPPVATAPPPAPVTATAALAVKPAPPPRQSFVRRYWWIFPVAALVAAGAAVGIWLALRPTVDCGAASLGCFDPR
jgi:tetratricopeptide (TPR) repeat protein